MPLNHFPKRRKTPLTPPINTDSPEDLDELAKLPFHHKGPFDRLIIVQTLVKNMTLVSKDKAFESYPVTIIW